MTYKGRVKNGVVVLDKPAKLPEGTRVAVRTRKRRGATLGDRLMEFCGVVKGLPRDLARNHDHYLHGMPKKRRPSSRTPPTIWRSSMPATNRIFERLR